MKSYNDKVKLMYKVLSKIYDLLDIVFFPIKSQNPRLGLAKAIPNKKLSILDICCGTGNSLIAVALKNNQNSITGIDLSVDMLKAAKKKAKKLGINNVTFQEMDATKLEAADNTFDSVTTSLSLHEMPKKVLDLVLSEMSRVTKRGGQIYIMEWDRPKDVLGAFIFAIIPSLIEPKAFKAFLDLDWEQVLSLHGLTLEGIQRYTFSKIIIARKN